MTKQYKDMEWLELYDLERQYKKELDDIEFWMRRKFEESRKEDEQRLAKYRAEQKEKRNAWLKTLPMYKRFYYTILGFLEELFDV